MVLYRKGSFVRKAVKMGGYGVLKWVHGIGRNNKEL
jgi:hypothetical protein